MPCQSVHTYFLQIYFLRIEACIPLLAIEVAVADLTNNFESTL